MGRQTCVLIGCGAIAREHLTALAGLSNVDVAAVCDLSAVRAEAAAERFAIPKWYTSHDKLLAEIKPDLVHITTTPSAHFAIARDCLAAGHNVLCEKPITVDYSEFLELKKLATENRRMLMENQQIRFSSSIQSIQQLLREGMLGDLLEVQVCIALNIFGPDSAYVDTNAPHFGLALRGGVIGDFLPHIAYLAHIFAGPIGDVRTIWRKHTADSPLPADEFCALLKGERANAYVSFSGNAKPDGFWVRLMGTKARVEVNIYEPPRVTAKKARRGEPALGSLVDGIAESRDIFRGTVAAFWRKLAGTSSYDGLPELLARTYRTLKAGEPAPIPLDEIDEIARLVDRLAMTEVKL